MKSHCKGNKYFLIKQKKRRKILRLYCLFMYFYKYYLPMKAA